MRKSHYTIFDRVLHRLALNFNSIAELSFDLDQKSIRQTRGDIVSKRHVFVAGLARAGTTVLMRRFYSTERYRSLTYRDMPFVLAPNSWRRLSSLSNRQIEYSERAHGDSLKINLDSPESFDEVFWRVFSGGDYLFQDYMIPYKPKQEILEKYLEYVGAILHAQERPCDRYLSKNNNNILRLAAIREIFPNALILIPYRSPVQQASSLLGQHENFCELQAKDKFTLSYMTWLGHHEFGIDHRPFRFRETDGGHYPINTLNYWLQLWCDTYSWLEENAGDSVMFVCYEDLCSDSYVWNRLAEIGECDAVVKDGDRFKVSMRTISEDIDPRLSELAAAVYARLTKKARDSLNA